jgi:hypothetical protein
MQAQSEYDKLFMIIDQYELILHPRIIEVMRTQFYKAAEEMKLKAYQEAKISDQALTIEKMLDKLKITMKQYEGFDDIKSFHIKCAYKEFLKLLN